MDGLEFGVISYNKVASFPPPSPPVPLTHHDASSRQDLLIHSEYEENEAAEAVIVTDSHPSAHPPQEPGPGRNPGAGVSYRLSSAAAGSGGDGYSSADLLGPIFEIGRPLLARQIFLSQRGARRRRPRGVACRPVWTLGTLDPVINGRRGAHRLLMEFLELISNTNQLRDVDRGNSSPPP